MARKPPSTPPSVEPVEDLPGEPVEDLPQVSTVPNDGNRFFSWIRSIDLHREPGWIGGVCAGIAARLGIDPLIVRGIAVVIAVLGGPAILLYAAAWLLLPDANDKIHLEEVLRGRLEPAIAGIGALIVLSLLPITQGFWFAGAGFWGEPHWGAALGRALWTIALIGLIAWFVVWIARRSSTGSPKPPTVARVTPEQGASAAFVATGATVAAPEDTATPELAQWRDKQAEVHAEQEAFRNQQASDRAAANRVAAEQAQRARAARREKDRAEHAASRSHPLYSLVVIGLALVAGGLTAVSFGDGAPTPLAVTVGLSVMLAVLALGIVVGGIRGKRSGGVGGVAALVLLGLLVAGSSTAGLSVVRWGSTSTLTPHESQDFAIGAGRVTLDLTRVDFAQPGPGFYGETVGLSLGAGNVTVIVPDDVIVQFSGTVAAGSIDAGDGERSTRVGPVETVYAEFVPDAGARTDDAASPQLIVNVQLGAGVIRVIEAGDN